MIRCLLWWCQERRASYLLSPSVGRSVEPRPVWLLRPHLAHPGTNSARPQGRRLLPASGWSGVYKLNSQVKQFCTLRFTGNISLTAVCLLWRCWLVGRKGIWPLKNWVVECWHGYLSEVRCKLAYGPQYFWKKISPQNLKRWWRTCLGSAWLLKILVLENLEWQTAGVLKIERSRYVVMMHSWSLKFIALPPSWIFRINFFNCVCTWELVLHSCAKFRGDRSYCCRDVTFFVIVFFLVKCINSLDGHIYHCITLSKL